jgi:HSP20 family molecular chaperone IbpA
LLLGGLGYEDIRSEPLWRSTVGFDHLFNLLDEIQHRTEDNYPPYNIERLGADRFQISLALAGFSPAEIAVTAEQNVLTVEGARATRTSTNISTRASRLGRSSGSSILPITSR